MDSSNEGPNFSIGQRVEVSGRDVTGSVAFIGTTSFAPGKWIGLLLDEPKGKNNGSFQGTVYFEAPENHGLFVRQGQLVPLEGESGKRSSIPGPAIKTTPPKPSPEEVKATKQSRSRFGFLVGLAPGKQSSSLQHIASDVATGSTNSITSSNEDVSSSSPFKFPSSPSSKSSVSKFKKMSFFSKLPKAPSKATTQTPENDRNNVNITFSEVPTRSVTFPGSFPTPTKRPIVAFSSSVSVDHDRMPVTPTIKITPARSSPQLNANTRASSYNSSIPFPSFEDLNGLQKSSSSLTCHGSGLESTTIGVQHFRYARGFASQGNVNQELGSTPPPPIKPPRRSILNTPQLVQPLLPSSTADTTPSAPPPSPKLVSGGRGGSTELTNGTPAASTSSITTGKYCKKPRRSSGSRLNLQGNRGAGYRSVRKLGTDAPTSESEVLGSSVVLNGVSMLINNQLPNSSCTDRPSKISRLIQPSFSTRLPIAGTIAKESPKSIQTSPSTSKSDLTTTTPTVTKAESNTSKRQSFIETIAEPIVPQYTQGPLFTPTMTPGGGPQGDDRFGAMQTIDALRHEVKDLNEKLEVLKAKRAADQDKLREIDRLKLQVETLTEFRTKVLENQASLQKELKKVKQDARDAVAGKEQHAEEMAELSETVEMATLDKEMAEEKAETLQLELEQCNEKIAQLTTELTAIKEELAGNMDPGLQTANSVQMKQVLGENARMREALLKLRDSSANDKHQHQKVVKEAEILKTEVSELTKSKEKLEAHCEDLELQISDLQEMNDAALGAEEMVVNLTEKNLNLEEKVAQLSEAVADLEALQDVNDQLQESAKEAEMEVREELRRALLTISNIGREKDALIETVLDREATAMRFRELVQRLRDDIYTLRKNQEEESSKTIPGLPEALDFKKIFAETKAQTTAIDLELRRIEAKEAALHATYLSGFMPEGFMKQGGDNDALLVLLLIPRMISKVELLQSQIRDKITPASFADGIQHNEEIAASPDVDRYAFSCQFSYLLYVLLSELHRWSTALNTCSTDDFLKVGVLFRELSNKEKAVDFYLELLRKSQLDENIQLERLEKCISSFQSFYSIHLSDEQLVHSTLVTDVCLSSAAASDCLIVDVIRLMQVLKKGERESDVGALLQDVKTIGESLRQLAKRTRRYLPDPPKQPPVSSKLQAQLLNDSIALIKAVKLFQETSKQATHHATISSPGNDGESISSSKMEEYFHAALEKCERRVEGGAGYKEVVKEWLTTALMTMTDLAQVVNEAPVIPKEKPPTPLSLRSEAVKSELDQSRNLRVQLEAKESAISELRKLIRSKQDELSEATIRKELAEKKLSNASKESEMTIEKLSRKLEDMLLNHQRKEREFQATMEHFQAEIDSIENEKGELKEKLMSTSKRRLLEGIAQSAASSAAASPVHGMSQVAVPVTQSTLVASSESISTTGLIEYARFLQRENWRLKSCKVFNTLKKLKPIDLPNKEDITAVRQLEKEYWRLKHEANTLLCESLKVALNKELTPNRKQYLLMSMTSNKCELASKMVDLKNRIDALVTSRNQSGIIRAEFATFSPQLPKDATDTVKVGMIRFPGWEKGNRKPARIVLSREQLQRIHNLLIPI